LLLKVPPRASFAALAAIALLIALYLLVPSVRSAVDTAMRALMVPDTSAAIGAFRDYLLSFGIWAPLVSAALMVLTCIIAPLPAFVVTFTNGLLFGWVWGALLSWSSAMVGAALCFWTARALGRPMVERLVGGTRALETSDLFVARHGTRSVLIARLLPFVSFDVVSYGAGLTPRSVGRYLLATGIGQLPATLVYSYLGQNLTGSVQTLFWVFSITAAIFVLASFIGPRVMRALRADKRPAPAGEVESV
jgi:uncharacterized membrane protein YdjX (TVP38/TMEM64 family)